MEDQNLYEYEYTMLSSPASLVINLDSPEVCSDARSVENEPSPASNSLPSFNVFKETSTISDNACWYRLPSVSERSVTPPNEATETYNANQSSEIDVISGEIKEITNRSFDMDNILGTERNCYSPRHSTPAKDVGLNITFTHQTLETENPPRSNVSDSLYPTFTTDAQLKATDQGQVCDDPNVYKRQEDKPPYTYVAMIIVAILNSEEKELTLAGIRDKLMEMFPFFRGEYTGWKNSVRHALSNSKCFYKLHKSDDQESAVSSVWKVNTKYVKHYTFNRQAKGPKYQHYKFTLQDELGLPPFDDSNEYNLEKDINLPPKPCFQGDSGSLTGSVSDFLNARNDSVPTPQSTVSDYDSAYSSIIDKRPSLKRKHYEEMTSAQQTTAEFKRQTTYYNYPHYGYQQYPQGAYHPTYYGSSYYNSTPMTVGDQWSRDYNQYGYPQQYSAQAMNVNAYSKEILAMRNLWWSYYNGMVPRSSHIPQNTTSSDWYPSVAINLSKRDGQSK